MYKFFCSLLVLLLLYQCLGIKLTVNFCTSVSDSTSSNVGTKKGAVGLIEKQLGKPLQWVPCMLHFVELPCRHLFYHFDGPTTGPIGPSGEIGLALKSLNENLRPFVDFQTVQSNLPVVPRELFRGKQDLLVFNDLVRAVESGVIDPVYVKKRLPAMSTVRWNTTWSRQSLFI